MSASGAGLEAQRTQLRAHSNAVGITTPVKEAASRLINMGAFAIASDAISAFEWWTGVWIPVIVGLASILVAVVALVLAGLANKQASTANATAEAALRISEESLRLSERQNQREEQVPRERVVDGAIRVFNTCWHHADEKEALLLLRFMPVIGALIDLAGSEGIQPASMKPLTSWLQRELTALEVGSTSDWSELHKLPSRDMVLLALRLSFANRCDEWSRAGMIQADVTVAEEFPDHFEPVTSSNS